MLTMLHRADGGPRPVNLDLALYVDELKDGGSSIMFGGGEWVTVSESVDEIMTLDADDRATAQAPALVDMPLTEVGDAPKTLTVAPSAVEWVEDYGGYRDRDRDRCRLRLRGDAEGEYDTIYLSREDALAKLGLAHQ